MVNYCSIVYYLHLFKVTSIGAHLCLFSPCMTERFPTVEGPLALFQQRRKKCWQIDENKSSCGVPLNLSWQICVPVCTWRGGGGWSEGEGREPGSGRGTTTVIFPFLTFVTLLEKIKRGKLGQGDQLFVSITIISTQLGGVIDILNHYQKLFPFRPFPCPYCPLSSFCYFSYMFAE
jgi:hypothetical protein